LLLTNDMTAFTVTLAAGTVPVTLLPVKLVRALPLPDNTDDVILPEALIVLADMFM
jgi:hypothetical protein